MNRSPSSKSRHVHERKALMGKFTACVNLLACGTCVWCCCIRKGCCSCNDPCACFKTGDSAAGQGCDSWVAMCRPGNKTALILTVLSGGYVGGTAYAWLGATESTCFIRPDNDAIMKIWKTHHTDPASNSSLPLSWSYQDRSGSFSDLPLRVPGFGTVTWDESTAGLYATLDDAERAVRLSPVDCESLVMV